MKTKILLAACSLMFIAGCETGEPSSAEAAKTAALKARSASLNAAAIAKPYGSRAVPISLFRRNETASGSGRDSATGEQIRTQCSVKGDGFSTSFTSPAKVKLPTYQGDVQLTNVMTLSCSFEGILYEQTYDLVNLSGRNRALGQGLSAAVTCGSVCQQLAAQRAMFPQPGDIYGYWQISLVLHAGKAKPTEEPVDEATRKANQEEFIKRAKCRNAVTIHCG